jgi:hypothetical protein
MPPGASPSVPPLAALMPIGREESDDPDSDKRHGQAKSDHKEDHCVIRPLYCQSPFEQTWSPASKLAESQARNAARGMPISC